MTQENRLIEGAIGPALLRFALPFLGASFLQALYGATDLFVVGQFSGSEAVSAVAIGSQIMQTITGIILGLATGGTVLIGRRIGERNDAGAARAVGSLAVLLILLAIVLTPIMVLSTNTIVSLMQTPMEAVAPARHYLLICACGIPFIIGYNAISGIFRGIGDSKTPMYFVLVTCLINVGLDFLLAGYFDYGAAGVAVATVAAQACSFLAFLFYMNRKGLPFAFSRRDIRLDKPAAAAILKVGFPLALQDALVNISFLAITMIVNTLGLVASAAVGVVERIIGFAMLPPSAFSSAVAAMSAQNIGAGKPERAWKTLWYAIGFSLVIGTAVCVYVQFFPSVLPRIFDKNSEVVLAASQYLRAYILDCILVSFVFCFNGYFSGLGKSVIAFGHSMAATFGVRIPVTYFMSRVATDSLFPMGLAAPAASLLSILICIVVLVYFARREKHASGGTLEKNA